MKINQFQEILVSPEIAVSTYPNGDNQCCVLIEQGQSFALNFGYNELSQLSELIVHLQEIENTLVENQKVRLDRETKLLASYAKTQLFLPEFPRN